MKLEGSAQDDLNRLLRKLVAGYSPLQVILFGSYACGEPDRDSDLDLLIVKETGATPFERRVEVRRICWDPNRRTPIQPLVVTPDELQERIDMGDPFFVEIIEKGEILYGA